MGASYLTNPQRLNLGAPVMAANAINDLKATMDQTNWLLGKRARRWVPVYDKREAEDETNHHRNRNKPPRRTQTKYRHNLPAWCPH